LCGGRNIREPKIERLRRPGQYGLCARRDRLRGMSCCRSAVRGEKRTVARLVDLSHVIVPGQAGRKFAREMVGAERVNPTCMEERLR
jgi:hypothetical protein